MKFFYHPTPWSFFHVLKGIFSPPCSLITSYSLNRYYRVMDYSYFAVWSNRQTNKKNMIFFSQIYHCEPPSSHKHSTVVRHSGTIVPFLAELSQTPNKIRAFFPTVTSHTHKYFDGYFWIYDALWWKYGKEQEVYVIYNFSHLKI